MKAKLTIYLLLLQLCYVNAQLVAQTIKGVIESDYHALVSFYHATGGENWADNTNWLSNEPVMFWYGVKVENERVTWLNLRDNNLTGHIPESLLDLDGLKSLYLSSNSLEGPIPSGINSLVFLETLSLDANRLTGPIPSTIGDLSELDYLGLAQNKLSDTLPTEIWNLSKLRRLRLNENRLYGTISDNIGSITNLVALNLRINRLHGPLPDELGELQQLTELSLDFNNFSGPIPASIGQLQSLERLDLGSNEFEGTVPKEIVSLPTLEYLNFGDNRLSGDLPSDLFDNCTIEHIVLGSNQFSASFPGSILQVHNLQFLQIVHNQFTALPDFTGLTELVHLGANDNLLTFEDILPNASLTDFRYSPQAPLSDGDFYRNPEDPILISLPVAGDGNIYEWYKNEELIEGNATSAITLDPNVDAGYHLQVTNSLAPDLILESGAYIVSTDPVPYNQSYIEHDPVLTLNSPMDQENIESTENAGDLNGDGIDDLIILFASEMHIYFGGSIGPEPDLIYRSWVNRCQGVTAGDFNNDNYSDIVLSTSDRYDWNNSNEVLVFFGSEEFDISKEDIKVPFYGEQASEFNLDNFINNMIVTNAGDVNGDLIDDLFVVV